MALSNRETSEAREILNLAKRAVENNKGFDSYYSEFKTRLFRSDFYRRTLSKDKRSRGFISNYIERGNETLGYQRNALISVISTIEDLLRD